MNGAVTEPTGSVTAPFIPYRIGVTDVPPEYGKHRYLTKGEASVFLTRNWQMQEATQYAYRLYKRLMYYTCERPEKFLPEVTETLVAFEQAMIDEQPRIERTAELLYEAGEDDLAAEYLTFYSNTKALDALDLGNA